MKCTNKYIGIALIISSLLLSGCGKEKEDYSTFDPYVTTYRYGITSLADDSSLGGKFFAQDILVNGVEDIGTSAVNSQLSQAGIVINTNTNTITYAKNIHTQIFPASTTKILTCLIACEKGNLDEVYTVSANAVKQASDSATIKLKAGDQITLRDLLYGMMLVSGNDAAVAIAEGIAGSVDEFANMMNERALSVGATNSHFANPNGLHDENHYTTTYDMYLILNEALKNPTFYTLFAATNYECTYTSNGQTTTGKWESTNQFIAGKQKFANGFTIIGGKTGTTGAAGYCLVLLSMNENHDSVISMVYNADSRNSLYTFTNEILTNYGN